MELQLELGVRLEECQRRAEFAARGLRKPLDGGWQVNNNDHGGQPDGVIEFPATERTKWRPLCARLHRGDTCWRPQPGLVLQDRGGLFISHKGVA